MGKCVRFAYKIIASMFVYSEKRSLRADEKLYCFSSALKPYFD